MAPSARIARSLSKGGKFDVPDAPLSITHELNWKKVHENAEELEISISQLCQISFYSISPKNNIVVTVFKCTSRKYQGMDLGCVVLGYKTNLNVSDQTGVMQTGSLCTLDLLWKGIRDRTLGNPQMFANQIAHF